MSNSSTLGLGSGGVHVGHQLVGVHFQTIGEGSQLGRLGGPQSMDGGALLLGLLDAGLHDAALTPTC